jgi:hypothetical protein
VDAFLSAPDRQLHGAAPMTIPYGTFPDALMTEETTALEPDASERSRSSP